MAVLALGCSADFDPPSELKTLRVLAVQKSEPYASPGEEVELGMLWYDGSPRAPRPVQLAWFSGCFNPPGDLYLGCFDVFSNLARASGGRRGSAGLPPGLDVGFGERFTLELPTDLISSRPPS